MAASAASLSGYGEISIAFEVTSVLDTVALAGGLGGRSLVERRLNSPYAKDYDAIEGEGPGQWVARFDVSRWGVLIARRAGQRVGSAVIARDTPGMDMLEGRADLAVLWDLRVAPRARRTGVGRELFLAAERWSIARGCRRIKIETQHVNVPACRFYASLGCTLGSINRCAYPELPNEVQLLWYKDLVA